MATPGAFVRYNDFSYRIGTAVSVATSSGFTTTETVTDTISVTLLSGRTYEVVHDGIWSSTVAGDGAQLRVREDSLTGTMLNGQDIHLQGAGRVYMSHLRALYTAVSSGLKTFVVTGVRNVGTGTITRNAATTNPSQFTVTQV